MLVVVPGFPGTREVERKPEDEPIAAGNLRQPRPHLIAVKQEKPVVVAVVIVGALEQELPIAVPWLFGVGRPGKILVGVVVLELVVVLADIGRNRVIRRAVEDIEAIHKLGVVVERACEDVLLIGNHQQANEAAHAIPISTFLRSQYSG